MSLKRSRMITVALPLTVGLALSPAILLAEITITLKNSFIKEFKDRALIQTAFIVDHAHDRPKKPGTNKPSNDGDIHISGRSSVIGMPAVAELMNAKDFMPVVTAINAVEGTGSAMQLEGVWRLWCEHGGNREFRQGASIPVPDDTNPDHVFEIHPLTKVDGTDLQASFKGIEDFRYKRAEEAFPRYESVRSKIESNSSTTTIRTSMAGFNYVEFKIKPRSESKIDRLDGFTVRASIFDPDGELLVRDRRLVFVAGTEPAAKVGELADGECMHVLGMPRISLTLVHWRTSAEGRARGALDWNLPYEMVILGVLSDSTECEADE